MERSSFDPATANLSIPVVLLVSHYFPSKAHHIPLYKTLHNGFKMDRAM
jgi:hypothetical protein